MKAALPFVRIVREHIHECAPDDCIETITVGALREAADAMEGLYEALRALCNGMDELDQAVNRETYTAARAALAKARGDQ